MAKTRDRGPGITPRTKGPGLAGRRRGAAIAAAALLLATLIVWQAWICDDAYITLRTVDHWVNGLGLRWNADERVQSYTHPLWLLLISSVYVFTREPYSTTLGVSLAVSFVVVVLYARAAAARGWQVAVAGLLAMAASRAFVEYSTSGLENPLSHLLVLSLVFLAASPLPSTRQVLLATASGALAACNRLDLLVIVAPMLWAVHRPLNRRDAARTALLGSIPLAGWLAFSVAYYGFPLPNTAYAKVGTGIPSLERLSQGLAYLRESFVSDPATLVVITSALWLASRDPRPLLRAAGVSLAGSAAYVVWVGGDFMSGRFLTPAFVLAVAIVTLCWESLTIQARHCLFAAALVLLAVRPVGGLVRAWALGPDREYRGIGDERQSYAPVTGLWSEGPGRAAGHAWSQEGRAARTANEGVVVRGPIGFFGYYAGPGVHVVDLHGLADPLMARLPSRRFSRVGHEVRSVPEGYLESLTAGANRLKDRRLVAFYDDLRVVTRGPLWTAERWITIARLNISRPPKPTAVVE